MAKVMITMPDEFLKKLDKVAIAEHRTRSELIREAVRAYVTNRGTGKRPSLLDKPSVRAAVQLQDRTREELKDTRFDSVALIRKMRGPLR